MKAALLVESLTGNTWKAAELVATELQGAGWDITGLSKVRQPDHGSIQAADLVLVGTWTHGLFVVGQGPWGAAALSQLPAMRGKKAAVFCTFALNPAKTLDKMTSIITGVGADVVGGLAMNRRHLERNAHEFAGRLLDAAPALV
ncbi:MAG TPA: flavodoxin family protein [Ilumatobacteraceae bacterium]|nr:flavodoxin family protein [Ilumatobacteraceae bacterium]